jgi:hypothetical protein
LDNHKQDYVQVLEGAPVPYGFINPFRALLDIIIHHCTEIWKKSGASEHFPHQVNEFAMRKWWLPELHGMASMLMPVRDNPVRTAHLLGYMVWRRLELVSSSVQTWMLP